MRIENRKPEAAVFVRKGGGGGKKQKPNILPNLF